MTKPVKQTTGHKLKLRLKSIKIDKRLIYPMVIESQTQLELNRGEKLGHGLGYKKQKPQQNCFCCGFWWR